jgi:hypothetical protein
MAGHFVLFCSGSSVAVASNGYKGKQQDMDQSNPPHMSKYSFSSISRNSGRNFSKKERWSVDRLVFFS